MYGTIRALNVQCDSLIETNIVPRVNRRYKVAGRIQEEIDRIAMGYKVQSRLKQNKRVNADNKIIPSGKLLNYCLILNSRLQFVIAVPW